MNQNFQLAKMGTLEWQYKELPQHLLKEEKI